VLWQSSPAPKRKQVVLVFKSRENKALPPVNSTLQLPPPGSLPPVPPLPPPPTVALDSDSVTRLLHLETPPPSCLQSCFLPAHEAITSPIFFFYNQQQQKNHCLSGSLQVTHLFKKIIKIKFSDSQRQLLKSDNHISSHEQKPNQKKERKDHATSFIYLFQQWLCKEASKQQLQQYSTKAHTHSLSLSLSLSLSD
jgi:hypothetical protein